MIAASRVFLEELDEETPSSKEEKEEIKDRIIELVSPTEGTLASIQSIKIRDSLNKAQRAYLTIDARGNVVKVLRVGRKR